jgi:hypothetical protein
VRLMPTRPPPRGSPASGLSGASQTAAGTINANTRRPGGVALSQATGRRSAGTEGPHPEGEVEGVHVRKDIPPVQHQECVSATSSRPTPSR